MLIHLIIPGIIGLVCVEYEIVSGIYVNLTNLRVYSILLLNIDHVKKISCELELKMWTYLQNPLSIPGIQALRLLKVFRISSIAHGFGGF